MGLSCVCTVVRGDDAGVRWRLWFSWVNFLKFKIIKGLSFLKFEKIKGLKNNLFLH